MLASRRAPGFISPQREKRPLTGPRFGSYNGTKRCVANEVTSSLACGFSPVRSPGCKETNRGYLFLLLFYKCTLYRFISAPGEDVVNEPGRTISWISALPLSDTPADVQSGDDGLLDVGEDSFLASDIAFTGYTIEFGGETYAIFGRQISNGAQYFIPYNAADGNLARLAEGEPRWVTPHGGTGHQLFRARDANRDARRQADHRDA